MNVSHQASGRNCTSASVNDSKRRTRHTSTTLSLNFALHFERGRNAPKAVQYFEHAGKAAVGRSAPREAVQHFTKAIGLLTTWPDSSERRQHELSLQLMRGAALMAIKGLAAPEVASVYARAWNLCQQLGEAAWWVRRGVRYRGFAGGQSTADRAWSLNQIRRCALSDARTIRG